MKKFTYVIIFCVCASPAFANGITVPFLTPYILQMIATANSMLYGEPDDGFAAYASQFTLADDVAWAKIIMPAGDIGPPFFGVNVDIGTYNGGDPVIFAGKHPVSITYDFERQNFAYPLSALVAGKQTASRSTHLVSADAFCAINASKANTGTLWGSPWEHCKASAANAPVHDEFGCPAYVFTGSDISKALLCDTGTTYLTTSAGVTLYSGLAVSGAGFKNRFGGIADYDGDGKNDGWLFWPGGNKACLILEADARASAGNSTAIALPGACSVTVSVPSTWTTDTVGWSTWSADYDGDGDPEFVIAASHAFQGRGAVFVVPGSAISAALGTHADISVSSSGVVRLAANHRKAWFGTIHFSAARDVNGNGTPDLVLGKDSDFESGNLLSGAVLVIDGSQVSTLLGQAQ